MTRLLKESNKVSLVLAVAFVFGILATFYSYYNTGNRLASGQVDGAWSGTYWASAIAFLFGAAAIYAAISYKREVIVYREKSLEEINQDAAAEQGAANQISLDAFRKAISEADTATAKLQAGLNNICKELEVGQGATYLATTENGVRKVVLASGYALNIGESAVISYEYGEGLVGQAASEGKALYIDDVPEGYIKIISGLGTASPRYLLIAPMLRGKDVAGVIELATFTPLSQEQRKFVEDAAAELSQSLNNNE